MASSSSGATWSVETVEEDGDASYFVDGDDDVGDFINHVALNCGGDDAWQEFCSHGPGFCGSCSDPAHTAPHAEDSVMEEEFDIDLPVAAAGSTPTIAPPFEGTTIFLAGKSEVGGKKRRVIARVSVITTEGVPKVLSPGDVSKFFTSSRYHPDLQNACCSRAKRRGTNCIEFGFTNSETLAEDVPAGLRFLAAFREETLNMTRAEKKGLVQERLRALWNGALTARPAGDEKKPQYFPYSALSEGVSVTLCQTSFAYLYDVTPNLVKELVTNIMAGYADLNPDKKHDYTGKTTFADVVYGDIKQIFENEGNIPVGT